MKIVFLILILTRISLKWKKEYIAYADKKEKSEYLPYDSGTVALYISFRVLNLHLEALLSALLPAEAIKSTTPRIIPIIRKYTQLIAAALSYCWSENTDCI